MDAEILKPAVALVVWSLVMWVWLYATRIPAMRKARIRLDPTLPRDQITGRLPAPVRWKADNYNHLMEQPTLFYAVVMVLAIAGAGEELNLGLAWAYVALRVAHSLWHALFNVMMVRFAIFTAASLVLSALAIRAAMAVF